MTWSATSCNQKPKMACKCIFPSKSSENDLKQPLSSILEGGLGSLLGGGGTSTNSINRAASHLIVIHLGKHGSAT